MARYTPHDHCPTCGDDLKDLVPINSVAPRPNPGDVTICGTCGQTLAFNDDLSVRLMTEEDEARLERNPEKDTFFAIAQMVKLTATKGDRKHAGSN